MWEISGVGEEVEGGEEGGGRGAEGDRGWDDPSPRIWGARVDHMCPKSP